MRNFLFPSIDNKALTRQIFEMIHYSGFRYEEIQSMPISKRHRYYYLLVKYTDRDNAVSKGLPAPPIDVSESDMRSDSKLTVEDVVNRAKRSLQSAAKVRETLNKEEAGLPSVIKEALNNLKEEGLTDERGGLKLIDKPIAVTPELAPAKKKIEMPDALKDLLKDVQRI